MNTHRDSRMKVKSSEEETLQTAASTIGRMRTAREENPGSDSDDESEESEEKEEETGPRKAGTNVFNSERAGMSSAIPKSAFLYRIGPYSYSPSCRMCQICNMETNKRGMQQHIESIHNIKGDFICPVEHCGQKFDNIVNAEDHVIFCHDLKLRWNILKTEDGIDKLFTWMEIFKDEEVRPSKPAKLNTQRKYAVLFQQWRTQEKISGDSR